MKLDTRNTCAARMLRVLNHIQRHLDEPLDLETLAGLTYFSVSHFHRVFKGMLGETIMDHLRRIRLERAHAQLTQSRRSVTDIGLDAGYDSLEAFSRVFRKTFGLSPSQCRGQSPEQNWSRPFPAAPSGIHYCGGEIVEILFDETGAARMNVRIENLPDLSILKVRQTGPYMESATRAWGMLCAWAGPKGLLGPETWFIGISHDDPQVTKPEDIRYDAAITRAREVATEPPVEAETLPGGEYAIITHQGPHENLEATYAHIMGQWMPASGRDFRDTPWFEVYRNDPATTPPDQLLTDIHIPLK
ncbi:MAG: AraC family transcriptional regulator [Proteobacteria bacterium]|nr:AraC family transcriptional regulator [Pseudomonadota bacterium]